LFIPPFYIVAKVNVIYYMLKIKFCDGKEEIKVWGKRVDKTVSEKIKILSIFKIYMSGFDLII